jgi:plastocyanin
MDINSCIVMRRTRGKTNKFPIVKYAIIGGLVAIIATVAYTGFASRTSIFPAANAKNFSLKIANTAQGVAFVSVGTSGKKSIATGHTSPTLDVIKGDTVTIHVINELHGEKYDFVIPDLNIHSKELGFFEADTITFVADKKGEFTYTSSNHPEMKGLFVVQ